MTRIVRAAEVLLAALIAAVAVWLGLIQSAAAAPAQPMPAATFEYDGNDHTALRADATAERGPPATYPLDTAHSAYSNRWSGTSTRSAVSTSCAYTNGNSLTRVACQGSIGATTPEQAQVADVEFAARDRVGVAAKSADEVLGALSYSTKIEGQMATRGWTKEAIETTIQNPTATHTVWDLTSGTKQAATAYVQRGGGYVVLNDKTRAVVQISNLNKTGWKPVWEDPRFMR